MMNLVYGYSETTTSFALFIPIGIEIFPSRSTSYSYVGLNTFKSFYCPFITMFVTILV